MTPDEWRRGMKNEATSVEDAEWSRATGRAVREGRWRYLGLSLLAGVGSATVLVLGVAAATAGMTAGAIDSAWMHDENLQLWSAVAALVLALALGWAGCAPGAVAVAAALVPLLYGLVTALIDLQVPRHGSGPLVDALADPVLTRAAINEVYWAPVRAVLGFSVAWCGARLARWHTLARRPA